MKTAVLHGFLMGYAGNEFTGLIYPAVTRLKIHAERVVYDPHVDWQGLKSAHPDIASTVRVYPESFYPVKVNGGLFEFTNVPVGWWDYVVTAYVGGSEYDHLSGLGNNGFGVAGVIQGKDLVVHNKNLEAIIIPVEGKVGRGKQYG